MRSFCHQRISGSSFRFQDIAGFFAILLQFTNHKEKNKKHKKSGNFAFSVSPVALFVFAILRFLRLTEGEGLGL